MLRRLSGTEKVKQTKIFAMPGETMGGLASRIERHRVCRDMMSYSAIGLFEGTNDISRRMVSNYGKVSPCHVKPVPPIE